MGFDLRDLSIELKMLTLYEIAKVIQRDWERVNFGAVP